MGHETIAPYLHPICGAPLGHQRPRGSVIVITDKGLLTTMTPLGNMVGNIWYNNSCDACHTHIMHTSGCIVNNKYCVPVYPAFCLSRRLSGLHGGRMIGHANVLCHHSDGFGFLDLPWRKTASRSCVLSSKKPSQRSITSRATAAASNAEPDECPRWISTTARGALPKSWVKIVMSSAS